MSGSPTLRAAGVAAPGGRACFRARLGIYPVLTLSLPEALPVVGEARLPAGPVEDDAVDDSVGTSPAMTASTARTSAAPLPEKSWSVQHTAHGARG